MCVGVTDRFEADEKGLSGISDMEEKGTDIHVFAVPTEFICGFSRVLHDSMRDVQG